MIINFLSSCFPVHHTYENVRHFNIRNVYICVLKWDGSLISCSPQYVGPNRANGFSDQELSRHSDTIISHHYRSIYFRFEIMRTVNTLVLYLIFVGRSIVPIAQDSNKYEDRVFFSVPAGYWPACNNFFVLLGRISVSRCRVNEKGVSNRTGNVGICKIFLSCSFMVARLKKIAMSWIEQLSIKTGTSNQIHRSVISVL